MQCKSNVNKGILGFVLVKSHNFRERFVYTPSHSRLMYCNVFTAPDAISLFIS